MRSKVNVYPHAVKQPVHIRRNVEAFDDPYIHDEQPAEQSVCRVCGDVYMSGRWYNPDQMPTKLDKPAHDQVNAVTCPACRKLKDRIPSGVLKLTGRFVLDHREEILNLIRNQTRKADLVNPLERIMTLKSQGDGIEITTTNEKLAQRIGKALHKAYSGHIEYKWSGDNRLARVNWHRES